MNHANEKAVADTTASSINQLQTQPNFNPDALVAQIDSSTVQAGADSYWLSGATPGDWQWWIDEFGPAVLPSVPDQRIPSGGKLAADEAAEAEKRGQPGYKEKLAKKPSAIDHRGRHRLDEWTRVPADDAAKAARGAEQTRWRADPRLNILLLLTAVRVIDIDVVDEGKADAIERRVIAALGVEPPVRCREGVGKRSLFVRVEGNRFMGKRVLTKNDVQNPITGEVTPSWGAIEFLGQRQQSVVVGLHDDGSRYFWKRIDPALGIEAFPLVTEQQMLDAFEALATIPDMHISKPLSFGDAPAQITGGVARHDDPIIKFCAEQGILGDCIDERAGRYTVLCPNRAQHTTDTDGTSSTTVMAARFDENGSLAIPTGFKCQHAHCAGINSRMFSELIGYRDKEIRESFGSDLIVEAPEQRAARLAAEASKRPFGGLSGQLAAFNGSLWKPHPHGLVPDGKGGYGATRNNLEAALRAPDFCLAVAFDEFLNETMVMDPATGEWRRFSDHDVFNAAACLEREGFKPIAKETMRDAILAVGNDNRIDSAKDWANSLEWDGVARIDLFLTKAFGAEASNYHTAISRYTWTALAGRVLQPGCKCDMVPIVSGPQGARKSSVVKAMAPFPEAFGELDLAAEESNLYRLMSGRLVMEMPELTGMRRREVEDLKRFVVAQENVWIEKWRTTPTNYKRRCLFIGTTNEEGILVDATGNRRWLPFRAGVVSMCDPGWVIANRDQLWAEGITLFKARGVMFEAAEQMAKAVHDQFMEQDPWEADIVVWLNTPGIGCKPIDRGYVTTAEVLRGIGLHASHINRASEMRAAWVLKKLGFVKARKRIDGAPPRPVFVKADEGS